MAAWVVAALLVAGAAALPHGTADFPLDVAPGQVVQGTPLIFDILDLNQQRVRDATLSFWISSNRTLSGDHLHNEILRLGTDRSFLFVRNNRIFCQTRNMPWSPGTPISMGYSRYDQTWVHFTLTFSNASWTSYLDGFPTGSQPLTGAFNDTGYGDSHGFLSVSGDNGEGNPNQFQIKHLMFENTVWSATQIQEHVLATAPPGAKLHVTRAYEQGFEQISNRSVFRSEYLFGPMPPPYSLPRLLFGQDDIPRIRAMFRDNDRMRTHLINAQVMIDDLRATRQTWLGRIPHQVDSTDGDAQEISALLFAAILVDDPVAHQLLADATIRIIRHKRQRILSAAAVSDEWELAGLPDLYHKDGLAIMLDLSGPFLSRSEIEEGLTILSVGAKGRRAIYSRHVTSQAFDDYARSRRYATMRRGSNRDIWEGTTLATIQLLLHGHQGLHDPNDVFAIYNMFHEQVRSSVSLAGVASESAGKTALWRGFLPWIMLARHRIPGIDNPVWNLPRVQKFASAKQLQMTPPSPIVADHGTWSKSEPRDTWSAFFTLLDGSVSENSDNAWLSRLADPHMPLKQRHAERLLLEGGTGLIQSTTTKELSLLFVDENYPIQAIYDRSGRPIGLQNSERSFLVTEKPMDVDFSSRWHFLLSIRTHSDGTSDGQLLSLFVEGDDDQPAIHVEVSNMGSTLTLSLDGDSTAKAVSTIQPDSWSDLRVYQQGSEVSINGDATVSCNLSGNISLLIGSFTSIRNRLQANQGVSQTAVRDVRLYANGLQYRWNSFPRSSFERKLREPVSLLSMLDHRHWSDGIPFVDWPSNRLRSCLFDETSGHFVFARSKSSLTSAVFVYSLDVSGGHVFKSGGHFDVYGLGTAWLFVENRMPVFAENYNSILIDGKQAPGVVDTEQGIFVQGQQTTLGGWVEIDLTWFYRHSSLVHDVNGVGYDESAEIPWDGIQVEKATRVISHVNIGPADRSVTIVSDSITMLDEANHTFTWLGQVMERHGVNFDDKPSEGLVDIWLEGDDERNFERTERKDSPLTVYGTVIPEQFAASFSGARRCLVRVLYVDTPSSLSYRSGERFRLSQYGQASNASVFDYPHGEFTHRIAKRIQLETTGRDGRFVVAIYPTAIGEELPSIHWSDSTKEVVLQDGGTVRRVSTTDGSIK